MSELELVGDTSGEGWWARFLGEGSPPYGFPLNANPNALIASLTVKSGAGTLFGFSGFNSKASAQFILVFDAQALPADGATAEIILSAPASSNFSADWGTWGRSFQQGIIICNSSTEPTKTIGAADCWFDAQYV